LRCERYREAFGNRDVATIKKQELLAWLTKEAAERNWKPSTRNRWQAGLSLIFRVGIDNEKIDKNPAAGIKRKTENNGRVRFLTAEEETALRQVIAKRFPKFLPHLEISLNTGMRQSEQYTLRWNQVDLERKIITLPKTKNGTTRHIPLNGAVLAALETLKKGTDGTGYVFPSGRTGDGLQGARGWFKSAVAEAGVSDYTWHCHRHTFASRLVMAGVDIRTVGELLGHKSLTMTMRYSHLAPDHNQAAVDKLMTFSTK
jgi:integrase